MCAISSAEALLAASLIIVWLFGWLVVRASDL